MFYYHLFYLFLAHIFFDDSWVDEEETGDRIPNDFVVDLVSMINQAARYVSKTGGVQKQLHISGLCYSNGRTH